MFKFHYWLISKIVYSFHYRFRLKKNLIKADLIKNGKTKWLDLGSSVSNTDNFFFCDILDKSEIPEVMRDRYFQ